MVICICRNVNEKTIKQEIENGHSTKTIIKKYDCMVCKKCIGYIKKLVDTTSR